MHCKRHGTACIAGNTNPLRFQLMQVAQASVGKRLLFRSPPCAPHLLTASHASPLPIRHHESAGDLCLTGDRFGHARARLSLAGGAGAKNGGGAGRRLSGEGAAAASGGTMRQFFASTGGCGMDEATIAPLPRKEVAAQDPPADRAICISDYSRSPSTCPLCCCTLVDEEVAAAMPWAPEADPQSPNFPHQRAPKMLSASVAPRAQHGGEEPGACTKP